MRPDGCHVYGPGTLATLQINERTMKTRSTTFLSVVLLLGVCSGTQAMYAQEGVSLPAAGAAMTEEEAVVQVARDLFDAMREGDGEKVRGLFVEGAVLQSAGERDGTPMLRTTPIEDFAAAVGRPHDVVWDERFWDTVVHIDGRLASMWMKYAFYLGDSFSHCGVDSFQLFKTEDGWKIAYLADTRQREGCEIPESVKPGGNGG